MQKIRAHNANAAIAFLQGDSEVEKEQQLVAFRARVQLKKRLCPDYANCTRHPFSTPSMGLNTEFPINQQSL